MGKTGAHRVYRRASGPASGSLVDSFTLGSPDLSRGCWLGPGGQVELASDGSEEGADDLGQCSGLLGGSLTHSHAVLIALDDIKGVSKVPFCNVEDDVSLVGRVHRCDSPQKDDL